MKRGTCLHRLTAHFLISLRLAALLVLASALAMPDSQAAAAVSQPGLLTATSFDVLAGQSVTNTGPTVIGEDLGLSPNGLASITGFTFSTSPGPGIVLGAVHAADAVALQAKNDLTAAYNTVAGETPCTVEPAIVGNLSLEPVMHFELVA